MQSFDGRIFLSPSDLNDYVNCRHLTTLAREVARGERERPHVADEGAKLLQEKGELHELNFLEQLRAEGRDVVEIAMDERWDFEAAAARTVDAMRAGADVIAQATFVNGPWRGRADFLMKSPRETKLGAWGYEALDAKLARAEKPTYVLQLCFYSDGVAAVQGQPPEHMHVHLGIGEQRTLRYDDFAAYYRRVRARFEEAIGSTSADRSLSGRALRPLRLSRRVSFTVDRRRSSGAGGRCAPRASRATARRRLADDDGARSGRA